ncbi:metal-dependent hydrolase family protein [Candidatus Viadribacter manganicus]|uniref:Xaa-Pro dipeptidase n=1 Tax=Candidatus Viadribacter manganicus TaxID=1759059 RepID=A0A1B1AEX4_9PROT|nr:amidohydrolase family protein [Candidatus Viadribacter manganicus]ANP45095.1 Xaa-Pro dipeptidase [Candidatus Viadribacter manganicus]
MLQRAITFAGALAALALLAGSSFAQEAAAPRVASIVHAGRLLADASTGRVLTEQSILVGADGNIISIEPGYVTRDGATVIDQRDRFVLAGLIDSHVHLTSELGPDQIIEEVTLTASDAALRGAENARTTLMAGFTTVADLGAPNDSIFALRRAIAERRIPGPRIIAAGSAVTPDGGHADANGFAPDILNVMRSPSACSGADACRRAVRRQIQAGADVIKITATGGVLSNTAAGVEQQFSDAELQAIVEAAHAMGRRVTAHAHGAGGINAALRAGVDSIEHGSYTDDESIRLLRRTRAYLVPTILAGVTVEELAAQGGVLTPNQAAKAREVGSRMRQSIIRARRAGVNVAFGTDSGVSRHGVNAREFQFLVEGGYTPMQAIAIATVNAADHLQLNGVAGRIAPGYAADIIAVDGDPTQDVTTLMHVGFVMARGAVAKDE